MKFTTLFTLLPVSAVFFCAAASASINGTPSAEMTFEAELTSTTCNAQITDAQGAPTDTIDYGEVYKSEIANKSRVVPFRIVVTACSGVDSVDLKVKPGGGGSCSGDASDGDSYAAGNNAAFELWLDEVDNGVELTCASPFALTPLSVLSGEADYDVYSRIVVANGKEIKDVTSGAVTAPITFTLTYR
ncbi:fimbrial protein [Salmonella enterica]|nr:fimbrial protein [Salmonella enterica]EEA2274099.1 fimbrial protein [Salmonella enterica]EFV5117219.1 fimbrial protein [Salmonella enterica]EGB7057702.1 fimbrial protein [Salmonella enterica]EKL9526569.1 fimbrial protein [Salmonella enterica]